MIRRKSPKFLKSMAPRSLTTFCRPYKKRKKCLLKLNETIKKALKSPPKNLIQILIVKQLLCSSTQTSALWTPSTNPQLSKKGPISTKNNRTKSGANSLRLLTKQTSAFITTEFSNWDRFPQTPTKRTPLQISRKNELKRQRSSKEVSQAKPNGNPDKSRTLSY